MANKLTEDEIVQAVCYAMMNAWQFNYHRRREWVIWSARQRVCPVCSVPAYSPCLNMAEVKRGVMAPSVNRQPHDPRIDWNQVLEGLQQRGYYRKTIEKQTRDAIRRRETFREKFR